MWQIYGTEAIVLTRGGLTNQFNRLFFFSQNILIVICLSVCQKSAEAIVITPNSDEGLNIECGGLPALYYWQRRQPTPIPRGLTRDDRAEPEDK